MKLFDCRTLPAAPAVMFSCLALAQPLDVDSTSKLTGQAGPSFSAEEALPATGHGAMSAKSDPEPARRTLPIGGTGARLRGFALPEPFGIGIGHMNIRQNIAVDSIAFSGLSIGSHAIPSDLFAIEVGKTRQRSETENLRFDAWLFPFLNVYGIVGYTRGSSLSEISVNSDPSRYGGLDYLIAAGVQIMNQNGQLTDLDFKLDFKGVTYGAGFTLAGGHGSWFALVDVNHTRTRFDVLDGHISAWTASPRIGHRFQVPGIDGRTNMHLWIGGMYQDVEQEFKGSLSNLSMPAALQPLIATANQSGSGRFDVKQHLESPWNTLVGGQYGITKNFTVLTEFGFSQRNSFFVSAEYRF